MTVCVCACPSPTTQLAETNTSRPEYNCETNPANDHIFYEEISVKGSVFLPNLACGDGQTCRILHGGLVLCTLSKPQINIPLEDRSKIRL